MEDSNPLVEVIHSQLGLQKVRKNFADIVLETRHIETGGTYCRPSEVDRYFEQLTPKAKQTATKTTRRKKVVTSEKSVSAES